MPIFRISIFNQIPYLGNFDYSPVYVYIRKKEGFITEIYTLESPSISKEQKFKPFLNKLAQKCRLKKIKLVNLSKFEI